MGENFCLPVENKDNTIIELIRNVEYNTNEFSTQNYLDIKNRSFNIIKKFFNSNPRRSPHHKFLIKASITAKKFVRDNPDIIFTKADKDNVTVAMNEEDYLFKMSYLLNDLNTYSIIQKDPTKILIRDLHCLLTRWKNNNYITNKMYKRLNCTDGVLPRAYGLPKIHKPDCPLRIIVSSINQYFAR